MRQDEPRKLERILLPALHARIDNFLTGLARA